MVKSEAREDFTVFKAWQQLCGGHWEGDFELFSWS